MARCCTVCTDDEGKEYLLFGDEMLWFGTALENSLINPNQIFAYGLSINDNPFNSTFPVVSNWMKSSSASIPSSFALKGSSLIEMP